MTTDTPDTASTPAHLSYGGASRVATSAGTSALELYGNLDRPAIGFTGIVKNPLRLREALSTLYAVVGADYRYQPKDRTQYLAYLRMKKETATQSIWQAQQAYFGWLLRNDPLQYCILDPVVSVHPDQVMFEVFAKDESSYACLSVNREAFEDVGDVKCGTTNIDFSDALYASVQQLRDYRRTTLRVGTTGVTVANQDQPEALEKSIRVPDSWLRGFLQVQSAAALPFDHVKLNPLDLYNALRHLRMHGDKKGQRRGLRIELVPAQPPKIVLEPWNALIETTAEPFKGRKASNIRVWGRRRLFTLRRFLPFVESVDVYLLGSGLPSFWVLRAKELTLTLGLTGFTAANWSSALNFDLLLPRQVNDPDSLPKVVQYLAGGVFVATKEEIGKQTGLKGAALTAALQLGCQHGQLMFDLAAGVYRLRPITDTKLDLAALQYRNAREKIAHDLLGRRNAVKIVSETRIAGEGLALVGEVAVSEDKRDYRPQMLLADEGSLKRVSCTCAAFRKDGLKNGPCVHLIALRMAHAEKEAKKAKTDDAITFETRAFTRRDSHDTEHLLQLTLERSKLKLRWGKVGEPMRAQVLKFNTEADARRSYFGRLAELGAQGYMDAIAE